MPDGKAPQTNFREDAARELGSWRNTTLLSRLFHPVSLRLPVRDRRKEWQYLFQPRMRQAEAIISVTSSAQVGPPKIPYVHVAEVRSRASEKHRITDK